MFKKVLQMIGSAFSFWKEFIKSPQKLEFLNKRASDLVTQLVVVASASVVCFVIYSSMKPVIKGTCRIVLQTDESILDGMRGRVVGVEAHRAVLGTTKREVKSIGVLKANAEAVIKSEIPGKISEVLFEEGGEVEQGQELIKIEDGHYRAEKEKCEAEYNLHKDEYERARKLKEQNVGSQKTLDEAKAKMDSSKAQLDMANFQLSKTNIKAPFAGTIGLLNDKVSPGNTVQTQTELVDLVDNSSVRVEFPVPAKYIEEIAVGQTVEITVDAFKDRSFSGVVVAIDPEVDTRNHSIRARAKIPNRGNVLRHGLFANVKVITGEKSNSVIVDDDALDREGSIEFVWVIDEKNHARRQRVLTGARGDNGIEIIDGLAAGTMVVTAGQLKLTDGITTNILNSDAETPVNNTSERSAGTTPTDAQAEPAPPPEKQNDADIKQEAEKGATTQSQNKAKQNEDGIITSIIKRIFKDRTVEPGAKKKAATPAKEKSSTQAALHPAKGKGSSEMDQSSEKIISNEDEPGESRNSGDTDQALHKSAPANQPSHADEKENSHTEEIKPAAEQTTPIEDTKGESTAENMQEPERPHAEGTKADSQEAKAAAGWNAITNFLQGEKKTQHERRVA
ncbi:MAG: efflux RND transporter periplasmic adaptor subunit [Holosporales bacterium]|jgi:membrane fusion protein (multidrug efflux system)|nr:efflux RND transporter periplasmic adaptor subunit [Holosporales bacterium]